MQIIKLIRLSTISWIPLLAARAAAQGAPAPSEPGSSADPTLRPSSTAAAPGEDDTRLRALEERNAALDERLRTLEKQGAARAPGPPEDEPPLAGYSDRNFFLRDRGDHFVLVPKGRVNVDYYHFLNRGDPPAGAQSNGPSDTRPKDTLFIRRARLGLAGTFAKIVDFRVEADFASQPGPGQYATLADASVVLNASSYLKLEVGQFYAPFTLENPTSENYADFMEKSAAVRFAVPTSRETGLMLLGELPRKSVRYWLGLFDGEGQNVKNLDDGPALIGRAIVAPLAFTRAHADWAENLWVGGSFWVERKTNVGGAAAPSVTGPSAGDLATFGTQGNWTIWNPSYANGVDTSGAAVRSHLAPDDGITKWALELHVPFGDRLGVRAELIHQTMGVRQYDDVNVSGTATRTAGARGKLTGTGGYAEAYVWLGQHVNVDMPGLYQVPHWRGYVAPPDPAWAVMLAAKYEHVGFDVEDLPRRTSSSGATVSDAALGHYALDVLELGGSLWYTRHSRFMLNYVLNVVSGGDDPSSALRKNLFYDRAEHELLARWAVSL